MTIPVVIAPVVSRYDLLERMVRSLDLPIRRLLIVDNGRTGYFLPAGIETGGSQEYIRPTMGLGYGGGINAGVMQSPDAPWWLWTSNDIVFGEGDLTHIAGVMADPAPRVITGGCTWGAVNRAAVDAAGLWDDQNFYPIYYDDNDFAYRCRLASVDWVEYWGNIRHGHHQMTESMTIRSDEQFRAANQVTFEMNHMNYLRKWGGEPHREVFTTPWDSGMPVWFIRPNLDHRATAAKAWERK